MKYYNKWFIDRLRKLNVHRHLFSQKNDLYENYLNPSSMKKQKREELQKINIVLILYIKKHKTIIN